MNLFGSYHCLPDCRPGFRVAPHGASCEGDRGRVWGCPHSSGPRLQQRRCCVPLGLWRKQTLSAEGAVRPGRKFELTRSGMANMLHLLPLARDPLLDHGLA